MVYGLWQLVKRFYWLLALVYDLETGFYSEFKKITKEGKIIANETG